MALTINTQPDDFFCNSALFNVTTSLTEGASFQNLRIKAELYYDGVIIATKVLRKGVSDFDFSEILRSLCQPYRPDLDSSLYYDLPGDPAGANLITSWSSAIYPFDAFTASGANITAMTESGSAFAQAQSNTFSITAGKYYVLRVPAQTIDSGTPVNITFDQDPTVITHHKKTVGRDSVSIYLFCSTRTSATARLFLTNASGNNTDYSDMDIELFELPSEPRMGALFGVEFTEQYENASDVTTEGGSAASRQFYFFDLEGTIDDYICDSSTKRLLVNYPEDPAGQDALYFFNHNAGNDWAEVQINFLSYLPNLQGDYYTYTGFRSIGGSGGSGTGASDSKNYFGYGAFILNKNNTDINSAINEIYVTLANYDTSVAASAYHFIRRVNKPVCPEMIRLEWTNRQGGIAQFTFSGGIEEIRKVERTSYRNSSNKNRTARTLKFTEKRLETDYQVKEILALVSEIIESKTVYKYDTVDGVETRTEVFVVSDSMRVQRDKDQLVGEITIEE